LCACGGRFDFSGRAQQYRLRDLFVLQPARGRDNALVVSFGKNHALATPPRLRLRLAGVNDVAHAL
jgi:hypothetical protein